MPDYCPLCLKKGIKAKMKAFRINFEEAVVLCETEECTWPMGQQVLEFISHPIEKYQNKEWDDVTAQASKKDIDPSYALTSYTPPLTPGSDISMKETHVTNDALAEDKSADLIEFCDVVDSKNNSGLDNFNNLLSQSTKGINSVSNDVVTKIEPKIISDEIIYRPDRSKNIELLGLRNYLSNRNKVTLKNSTRPIENRPISKSKNILPKPSSNNINFNQPKENTSHAINKEEKPSLFQRKILTKSLKCNRVKMYPNKKYTKFDFNDILRSNDKNFNGNNEDEKKEIVVHDDDSKSSLDFDTKNNINYLIEENKINVKIENDNLVKNHYAKEPQAISNFNSEGFDELFDVITTEPVNVKMDWLDDLLLSSSE